jgi:hypothetical protein
MVLKSPDKTAVVMANFDVVPVAKNVNFGAAGNWKEYFTNAEITTTSETESIILNPGEYKLYFEQ